MLRRLRSRLHGEGGFTLIELLVVILIIGILAAIAIPSFLNQKGKGDDASIKSNVRNAQTAMETYYTDNNDYSGADGSKLNTIESSVPASVVVTNSAGTSSTQPTGSPSSANGYRIRLVGTGTNPRTFWVDKTSTGTVTRGCTPVNTGGCPNSGQW